MKTIKEVVDSMMKGVKNFLKRLGKEDVPANKDGNLSLDREEENRVNQLERKYEYIYKGDEAKGLDNLTKTKEVNPKGETSIKLTPIVKDNEKIREPKPTGDNQTKSKEEPTENNQTISTSKDKSAKELEQ